MKEKYENKSRNYLGETNLEEFFLQYPEQLFFIKIECAIKDYPHGWGGYMTNNLPILTIIQNLKVNDYDYDYLSILQIQVRLLKMIMCFRFLQHKF